MAAQRWWVGIALTVLAVAVAAPAVAAPADEQPTDPSPAPPVPAQLIPQTSTIGSVLAQSGSDPVGPLGLPDLSALGSSLLLGRNAAPAAPGATDPVVVPNLSAFNAEYLLPQNLLPAAPGQGAPAPGIGPDQDSPSAGRIAFLRRLNEMYQAGELKGAFLGQLPKEQLGEPLPGTAPGPGIYLSSGLGQSPPGPIPPVG